MNEPCFLGNCDLLKKPIIGFFSSRTTAPLSVLPTFDWAHEVSKREDVAIMSGFQSAMEREVLDILLSGKCDVIMVLNRSIYKQVPQCFKIPYEEGRLLFVSLVSGNVVRPSKVQAEKRNRYIAETASSLVFSSVTAESSLYGLSREFVGKIVRLF